MLRSSKGKVGAASLGSRTTGSFSLNEVFSTMGTPVRSGSGLIQTQKTTMAARTTADRKLTASLS